MHSHGHCDARVCALAGRLSGGPESRVGVIGAGADAWCLRRINVPASISVRHSKLTAGLQFKEERMADFQSRVGGLRI